MAEEKLTLLQKLLAIQKSVDRIVKGGKNKEYDFASSENVLDEFRPLFNEYGLLLEQEVKETEVLQGETKAGTRIYFTGIHYIMRWIDVESGDTREVPWYAQGVDIAGEKGVGKSATYAEKYFLLKYFHVPTKKDDPDEDEYTLRGEKKQRKGSQAAKETAQYQRAAVSQMLNELYSGDAEKISGALVFLTKNDSRGFAGYKSVDELSDAILPLVYDKLKKTYEDRLKKPFVFESEGK